MTIVTMTKHLIQETYN